MGSRDPFLFVSKGSVISFLADQLDCDKGSKKDKSLERQAREDVYVYSNAKGLNCYTVTNSEIAKLSRMRSPYETGANCMLAGKALSYEYVKRRWRLVENEATLWQRVLVDNEQIDFDSALVDVETPYLSTTWFYFDAMLGLDGELIGGKLKKQIEMRRDFDKSCEADLGSKDFDVSVVTRCSVFLKSSNKKPLSDPKAKINLKVKTSFWNGDRRENFQLVYDLESNKLLRNGVEFTCTNIDSVLEYVRGQLSGFGGS